MSSEKHRDRGSGRVRIIGGSWRGRRIRVPAGTSVRPTPDRVRETLFNWLTDVVPGARCLDLFSGTGVLGLEALSRGAREVWLAERDPVLVRALGELKEELGANARIVPGDALELLGRPAKESFDIVFADPPYEMELTSVLDGLTGWLTTDNYVYIERPARRGEDPVAEAAELVPGSSVLRQDRAGAVAYGLLRLQI